MRSRLLQHYVLATYIEFQMSTSSPIRNPRPTGVDSVVSLPATPNLATANKAQDANRITGTVSGQEDDWINYNTPLLREYAARQVNPPLLGRVNVEVSIF